MNPLKCAFGVTSGKIFGFIVRHQGIKIDQTKIDVLLKMFKPRNINELKSLQGKLAYLRRSISNLSRKCQHSVVLWKRALFSNGTKLVVMPLRIKSYLIKPPALAAPIPGKPLILYISAQERSVGALLTQENGDGKENSLFYLSRMMIPNELKYSPLESYVCPWSSQFRRWNSTFKIMSSVLFLNQIPSNLWCWNPSPTID